ncbi:MAG: hypothetical protein S4CHLAM20_14580 [Chlamydiia bacterium]|nr:hypothetical protein [Chlamydiia bacterium]
MHTIPHIALLYELNDSISPIKSVIEPLYSYLYCLNSKTAKERKKPSGFYFLLENRFDKQLSLNSILDLYRSVTSTLVILSEIEKYRDEFKPFNNLSAWLSTVIALKDQIDDISPEIRKLKRDQGVIWEKPLCKRLFLFAESVRALLEELLTLKKTLLEEVLTLKDPFLTKEPLDLKGDLE